MLIGILGAHAAAAQEPVFRAGAENVPVFVTATDKEGRLVTDLAREDFRLFDNGKPQPIAVFDRSPQPIRLIVMLDVSGSMAGNLPILRAACSQLIDRLDARDLARIGAFGEQIDVGAAFTRDPAELLASLPTFIPPNAPTPLWTAVDRAIGELERDSTGPAGPSASGSRPVVLVMSDGKDSGPRFGRRWVSQLDVADRAQREDVMIYAVGLQSRGPLGGGSLRDQLVAHLPDPGLGTVALETGGGYYELRPRDDLGAAFARVADELHQQYLLGFAPPSRDGKVHKIEVRVARKDVKARARKTYRAPAE